MDLKQLEYFVRVAELGSFSRAALQLGLTQPMLSRQVRALEVSLRQNLLVRNGRGARPTEGGKLLLEHARGILHQVALAQENLNDQRSALAGRVSIGLPPSLSKLMTVPLAKAFLSHLPQAQLSLTEGFSLSMLEGLRLGNLDMALLYNPAASVDLEQQLLHEQAVVLISGQDRPKTVNPIDLARPEQMECAASNQSLNECMSLNDVARLPLILPSRPNAFRQMLDQAMSQRGLAPRVVMEVDGLNAILSLVQEGLGHAVLPRYTLEQFPSKAFRVRGIEQPQLMSRLMLVTPSLRPSTLTQQKAKTLLQEVVQQALQA
jgi:LysR family transcriptional regulator, nitrogen assimilation regulatory protein